MNSTSMISVSASFTCNSSNNLADTADRVIQELRGEKGFHDDDIFDFSDYDEVNTSTRTETVEENEEDDSDEGEQEFEFAVACRDSNSSAISASAIFSDGQIYPRYPIFGRSLLLDHVGPDFNTVVDSSETESKPSPAVRLSLRKLFSEDCDSSSSSSSEAGDLDGIKPGTYCVWTPKTVSTGKHKKSYSTGNTSNRWKVRDLLKRSYSDDNYSTCKDTSLVVFTPSIATKKKQRDEKVKKVKVASAVGDGRNNKNPANKAKTGGYCRRPYLPYRHD